MDWASLEFNLKISVQSGGGIVVMYGFNLCLCIIIACLNTGAYGLLLMFFLLGICGASFFEIIICVYPVFLLMKILILVSFSQMLVFSVYHYD